MKDYLESIWNASAGEFLTGTLILFGVMIGVYLVIAVVMFKWFKRQIRKMYSKKKWNERKH